MKKLFLITLLISSITFSQPVKFERVTQTDSSITKEVLFNRLSSRLINHIEGQDKYEKSIIQSNFETGVIIFNQKMSYNPKGNRSDDGLLHYKVNAYFKDGRFKIILSEIIHEGKGLSLYQLTEDTEYPYEKRNFLKYRIKWWKEVKGFANIEMPKILTKFERIILTPTEQEKDW